MHVCPRCRRSNPLEAVYCYFDGAELRPAHGLGETQRQTRLPHEFVFPSGRRCQTYDELVQGCQGEWNVARDLLKQGIFRQFLSSVGRMDLAQSAQVAKSQTDLDVALDTFITNLPATVKEGPRLDLNPRRLILGTVHVGDVRQVRLTVSNQGKGLLHGTLTISEGQPWLQLADSKSNGELTIKTANEQVVTLRVDTRGLAAPHKYSAKLTVLTNGGIVEVPVRLDVAVHPFPQPPFQGVASPREMAEKMRTQPKPAVPLLESGEVARWFAVNGWSYPVQGPPARGVAAVQQFFEGMGLSKPPVIQLAEQEVYVSCQQGEPAQGQISLHTPAKKWVYARAEADCPWLRITTPSASGPQRAVIAFTVQSATLAPGRVHEAVIRIVANAEQKLTVGVRVRVEGKRAPPAPRPSLLRPVLVGIIAAMVLRLLLALPADVFARLLVTNAETGSAAFSGWFDSPTDAATYAKLFVKHFVLATWWIVGIVSAVALWRRGGLADAFFGLIAGAIGGLAVSATLACLLPTFDLLPRWLWHVLAEGTNKILPSTSPALLLPLWLVLVVANAGLLGGVVGAVLASAGDAGRRVLAGLSYWLARLFQLCRLKQAAAFFALS
jgi:hypothetical protein